MIRLNLPDGIPSYSDLIDKLCEPNIRYKNHIINNKEYLVNKAGEYKRYANKNDLYKFDKLIQQNNIIYADLESIHMIDLYNYCLRDKGISEVYNKILNLAKDPRVYCPFCNGINPPTEIDHFLPKRRYAHFSVFPFNLIPICHDCNSTKHKGEFFPINKNEQLIHPYFDDDCFFSERWLFADYIDDGTEFGFIDYSITPPSNWCADKKEKIIFHVKRLGLLKRLRSKSVELLSDLVTDIKFYKGKNSMIEDFKDQLNYKIKNEIKINSWKKASYEAIKAKIYILWNKF